MSCLLWLSSAALLSGYVLGAIAGGSAHSDGLTVDLGYATYQGVFNSSVDITTFTGMRYAAPTSGKNRFQKPKPPATVKGVQVANVQPNPCPPGDLGINSTEPFSKRTDSDPEDCLFLNVFVSGKVNPKAKMPTVVWIHGGGYIRGSQSGYDAFDFINDANGGVVVVVIQYRLGLFGFISSADIKKHGTLNAGLYDQQFALQWVQKNIELFGGDPHKVTIWGQSAGAGSVLQHLIANDGKTNPPLFRAAITSSTFLPSQYPFDHRIPEEVYSAIVMQSGCSSAKNTFACLQDVDIQTLMTVNMNVSAAAFFGAFVLVPVVDGELIVRSPTASFKKGAVNGQYYMANSNVDEGSSFVSPTIGTNGTLAQYVTQLFPTLSKLQVHEVANLYSNILGLEGTYLRAAAIMGESIFICPTRLALNAFPGGRAHKSTFAIPPAHHADDVGYLFPSSFGRNFPNPTFTTSFAQVFLAFVKTLDPNDTPDPENITPHWPAYDFRHIEMLYNETNSATDPQPVIHTFRTDLGLLERCAFWRTLAPVIGQ